MGGSLNSFVDPSAWDGKGDTDSVSAMRNDIADVVIIELRELSSSLIVFPVVVVAARFVTIGRKMRTRGEDNVVVGTANPFAMSTAHATSKRITQVNRLAVVMMMMAALSCTTPKIELIIKEECADNYRMFALLETFLPRFLADFDVYYYSNFSTGATHLRTIQV
jgi:hypothetical protein